MLYQAADVLVIPSIYEPLGYVALEAMANRVPVIASDTGGLREILEDGKNGILIPLKETNNGQREPDLMKLVNAQIFVLSNVEDLRQQVAEAFHHVSTKFRLASMIDGIVDVYRRSRFSNVAESHKFESQQ